MINRGTHRMLAKVDAKFHIVPVDFVARALTTILEKPDSTGKTFHLADPSPPSFRQFFEQACDAFGAPRPSLYVPPFVMRTLRRVPGVQRLVGVPAQAF